jgi:segregation and condensation protein B
MDKEVALIEAVLFLEFEPLDRKKLSKITQLSLEVIDTALVSLKAKYDASNSGLELVEIGGGLSLVPKKEFWPYLKDFYGKRNEDKLSRAALETLSIIAYSQPITKVEIESIRGVSVSGIIKMLEERELIKEVGRKDAPGRPVQYGTTREFLKVFRLNSLADLPKLDDWMEGKFELENHQS